MRRDVLGLLCCVVALAGCGGDDSGVGPTPVDEPTANCITDTRPTERADVRCNGIRFTVSVPDGCDRGGCGLIFDLHGSTGNADDLEATTRMRERGWLSRPPYIVVQPNANGNPSNWSRADDEVVLDFMRQAIEAWRVDENRVHMGGPSAGGFVAWRIACRPSHLVASFAPIAALPDSFGCYGSEAGALNPNAPILHIHSPEDTVVRFSAVERLRDRIIAAMGQEHRAEVLFQHNGSIRTRHSGNGLQYDLLEHPGGHCIHGLGPPLGCGDLGFDAGEVVFRFYVDHPRR